MHITLVCIFMLVVSMPASAQVYATSEDNSYNYNAYRSNVYKPGSSTPNSSLGRKSTNAYDPWSGSYAPMRKNSSTGTPGDGALGEDETSENDPEGETGAPDGFITPSDPGHQSDQAPVGEAWILLLFAAAAALVVFIRQKREKKHIAIYSENQQQAETSNMKQHIRKSLFISIILLAGVSNAWAWDIYGNLYFNNSSKNWSNVSLIVGNDGWHQGYKFTKLNNTQLYYSWVNYGGYNDLYFINGNYTSNGNSKPFDKETSYTRWQPGKFDYKESKQWYFDATTQDKTLLLPKYTATADIKISEDGGNTYAVTHNITLGVLTLTGTYMNGNVDTGQSTETTDGTYDYKYQNIPVTGEFTLTNTSVTNAAYEFVGFGTGDKPTINSNSHTWNVTANTTYYAFYKRKQYTINYGVYNSVGGSIKLNSGSSVTSVQSTPINHGTNLTFTITPATGYQIEGWYSNSSCTSKITSAGTSSTYTINNLTAVKTVYVKFKANTYTVTLDPQNGESTNAVTATYGSAMPSITIPTRTGYTFGGYYTATNGGGTKYYNANGTSAKNWAIASNTTLYAKWTETKHSITVNANPQSYGKVSTNSVSVGQFTSSANITATANEGYEFVNWTATEGITINNPNNATTTIKATKAGTLTANFQALPGKTVYLKPVDYWLDANARFAVYAWNNSGNEWIEMEDVGCNREYFVADIPAQYQDFIFVRINPAATELSFANDVAWNKTPDLTIPTDGKNLLIYPRIYLKPNSNWTADNARSSAYFFEDGKEARWMSMYKDGDYYYCQVPGEDHANVIFARMNPNTSDNNFNDGVCWNKTRDLTIQGNCYTLSGALNDLSGSWSTLWTTYSAPKYSVTLNATKNGTTTATYNSTTTTSKNNGTATLTNIPLNQNVTFTFEPAEGYQFANAKITIGNQELEVYTSTFTYPICGPATVSAHFVSTETRKVYLRPNDEWMINSPIFAAYAYKNGSDSHQWYIMNTEDTDYTGAYSCDISTTYDHVHFVRINPNGSNPHNHGIN
ncbi:MAG: InlB B-repeat-containing protein, partial [Paludibacteraceae bacterium]|nr:InlB B-repeat-containing protein [Paludibacteraceae bacterium]